MQTIKIKNKENPKDFRGFENVKHFQTFQAFIFWGQK